MVPTYRINYKLFVVSIADGKLLSAFLLIKYWHYSKSRFMTCFYSFCYHLLLKCHSSLHCGPAPSTFTLTNHEHHLSALLTEASQTVNSNPVYVQKRIFQNHFSSIHEKRNRYSGFQNSAGKCSQTSIRVTFQIVCKCLLHDCYTHHTKPGPCSVSIIKSSAGSTPCMYQD